MKLARFCLTTLFISQSVYGFDHMTSKSPAPPLYRKIALNGSIKQDLNPINQNQLDSEPEETYIDALTLDLNHSVTDIYVTFVDNYLPLEVRRNSYAEQLSQHVETSTPYGRPFGHGWSSNIGNFLRLTSSTNSTTEALLLDEQGVPHHFISTTTGDQRLQFKPVSDTGHHQDARRMQLVHFKDGGFEFTKPYGTQLFFKPIESSTQNPKLYRCTQATHPSGIRLTYRYAHDNKTTIPNEIYFGHCRIRIETNEDGLISRIIDPRGYDFLYEYTTLPIKGGNSIKVLDSVYKPVIDGKRTSINYAYELVALAGDATLQQLSLAQIQDGLGHSHRFTYQNDTRDPTKPKRIIQEIELPGIAQKTQFASTWLNSSANKYLATRVINTIGCAKVFEFRDWQTTTTQQVSAATDCYTRMLIKQFSSDGVQLDTQTNRAHTTGDTELLCMEAYALNPLANYALSQTIDMGRNTTQYTYADLLPQSNQTGDTQHYYSNINEVTDAQGNPTTYTYGGPFQQELSRKDAEGRIIHYTRDETTGELTSYALYANETDLKNKQVYYQENYLYEDSRFPGFCTQKVIKQLNITADSPEWECDLITYYTADQFGRLAQIISDPGGLNEITSYKHTLNGNKHIKTYRNGYTEIYTYDGYNRIREIFYPSDLSTKFITEDARGNDIEVVEQDGTVTKMKYDKLSRLVLKTTIDSETTSEQSIGYNNINTKLFEKNNGELTEYSYEPLGRVIQIKAPGETTNYKYDDKNGSSWLFEESEMKPSWIESTNTYPYTIEYDSNQRITAHYDIVEGTKEQSGEFQYDKVGNKTLQIINGEKTTYTYDAMDRLIREVKPDGTVENHLYTSTNLHYGTSYPDGNFLLKVYDSVGDDITPNVE